MTLDASNSELDGAERQMPIERVREVLNYDPGTGEFTWRVTLSSRAVAGKAAGSPVAGYRRVCIDGRAYRSHRLAWLLAHGSWPSGEIDHINGDKSDNRLANLRDVAHAQNCANRKSPLGASGFRGVFKRGVRWQAEIWISGKKTILGRFDTAEAASEAFLAADATRAEYRPGASLRQARSIHRRIGEVLNPPPQEQDEGTAHSTSPAEAGFHAASDDPVDASRGLEE